MQTTDLQNEKVMALWWKQPYASAMLIGKIETRTWKTNVRGKVLICASKEEYSFREVDRISGNTRDRLYSELTFKAQTLGNFGNAIAIGDLVDCRPMTPEDKEKCFVRYREGLYCHVYENVRAIKPFEMKGCQGWRILTEEQKSKIEYYENI